MCSSLIGKLVDAESKRLKTPRPDQEYSCRGDGELALVSVTVVLFVSVVAAAVTAECCIADVSEHCRSIPETIVLYCIKIF